VKLTLFFHQIFHQTADIADFPLEFGTAFRLAAGQDGGPRRRFRFQPRGRFPIRNLRSDLPSLVSRF